MRLMIATFVLMLLIGAPSHAADWLRYPALSPDGTTIAFSFKGDLWLVPAKGGDAKQLTVHEAYESSPVWSRDSKHIAFASDRHGNDDVFIVPRTGGRAKRLTYHSTSDTPTDFSPDGKSVLFTSRRLDSPKASIPSTYLGELYAISVDGGRPIQILTTPAEDARFSPDGQTIIYHDHKGFENAWRKHHTSAIARDIWLYDTKTGTHTKRTDFAGEDRNPVWSRDGKHVFYLSEKSGNFNIWQQATDGKKPPQQLTQFAPHPVRFLSVADNGTLCFGYNGDIWTKATNAEPKRLAIDAITGEKQNDTDIRTFRDGVTDFAVSPLEDEVAFIVRGELFAASVEYGTTRRLTNTPTQERSITWAPDGRTIYFAGERDGSWNLYTVSLDREDEDRFFRATILSENTVLRTKDETFQPVASPDGKHIAFLRNRDEIAVLELATKKIRTLVPAVNNYSYSDGDIDYRWSADSQWLTFNYMGRRRWIEDVGVVNVATGTVTNMTDSGYYELASQFSRDGNALVFYSNRYGRRNHGSWGSDGDVFALYLTQKAYDRAKLSREDFDRLKEQEEKEKNKDKKKEDDNQNDEKQDKDKANDAENDRPVPPVDINFDNREYRVRRLTMHSAPIGDFAMASDGESVVYFAQVERKWDLWVAKMRDNETRKILTLNDDKAGRLHFSKDGKSLFIQRGNGRLERVKLGNALSPSNGDGDQNGGGRVKSEPIKFAAEMTIQSAAEREYLFEHVWRQTARKFYDPKLHGVDWPALKTNYQRFIPSITHNRDFAELLSEMLGELNASHTGSGYRPKRDDGDETASLDMLFDVAHRGDGLRVAEVFERGAVDNDDANIKPGTLITHIDGVALTPQTNHHQLLNRKAGQRVRLTLVDPGAEKPREYVVKPSNGNAIRGLHYDRWVKQRRQLVDKLSKGRVGYLHVRSMNDSSFRTTYHDALGRNSDKEALIVDTRFNGGGWLHDDLVKFLDGGKPYAYFVPRGKKVGDMGAEPLFRWSRPVALIVSESNYSDAHFFPYAFKHRKLGKVIGMPVPGTATAVWWETLIDPTLYFGIPQVGMVTPSGQYLENLQLEPDVRVFNDPQSVAEGKDKQLERAVVELLKDLKQ